MREVLRKNSVVTLCAILQGSRHGYSKGGCRMAHKVIHISTVPCTHTPSISNSSERSALDRLTALQRRQSMPQSYVMDLLRLNPQKSFKIQMRNTVGKNWEELLGECATIALCIPVCAT